MRRDTLDIRMSEQECEGACCLCERASRTQNKTTTKATAQRAEQRADLRRKRLERGRRLLALHTRAKNCICQYCAEIETAQHKFDAQEHRPMTVNHELRKRFAQSKEGRV